MELNGTLMSGDTPAASIQNGKLTPLEPSRMPLYLANGGGLEHWLTGRAIDRHRPNSRLLKKVLRLSDTSDLAAVLRAHAAAITDNYWVRLEGEALAYADVRFTENAFAELALNGGFDSFDREYPAHTRTPELTNIGSFEKCWRLENGAWYLVKRGSPEERYSELFISRLGKALGFSMAEYEPEESHVKTKDFTGGRLNFEPAAAFVGDNEDYAFNYDRLEALCPDFGAQYLDILYLDALCFNMDRHTYNYGILREPDTGELVSMAPNFDNNIALISRGYGASPIGSNGLLIDLFFELLAARKLSYRAPGLDAGTLQTLVGSTLPGEGIDREYVRQFVWDRYLRLERGLREREKPARTSKTR